MDKRIESMNLKFDELEFQREDQERVIDSLK